MSPQPLAGVKLYEQTSNKLASEDSTGTGGFTAYSSEASDSNAAFIDCACSKEPESVHTRMQRWQERKIARQQKRKNSGSLQYGMLARAVVISNNADTDIVNISQEKGLPVFCTELLGSGSFARVYKGTWTFTGGEADQTLDEIPSSGVVAVKCIRRRRTNPSDSQPGHPAWLEREAQTSLAQKHPNLVRMYRASIEKPPYLFVMEFCAGGTLHELIHGSNVSDDSRPRLSRLTWKQRLKVARDIAAGMEHMHSSSIMHRDLKSQNVLLAQRVGSPEDVPVAKVGDFGLARYVEDGGGELSVQVGSWQYMAPEVFEGSSLMYDRKIDVYSYAMILFELITDEMPFSELKSKDRLKLGLLVVDGQRPKATLVLQGALPRFLEQLMISCWSGDPEQRPSFRDIVRKLCEEASRRGDAAPCAAGRAAPGCAVALCSLLRAVLRAPLSPCVT